jgi:hypothetical protein
LSWAFDLWIFLSWGIVLFPLDILVFALAFEGFSWYQACQSCRFAVRTRGFLGVWSFFHWFRRQLSLVSWAFSGFLGLLGFCHCWFCPAFRNCIFTLVAGFIPKSLLVLGRRCCDFIRLAFSFWFCFDSCSSFV